MNFLEKLKALTNVNTGTRNSTSKVEEIIKTGSNGTFNISTALLEKINLEPGCEVSLGETEDGRIIMFGVPAELEISTKAIVSKKEKSGFCTFSSTAAYNLLKQKHLADVVEPSSMIFELEKSEEEDGIVFYELVFKSIRKIAKRAKKDSQMELPLEVIEDLQNKSKDLTDEAYNAFGEDVGF